MMLLVLLTACHLQMAEDSRKWGFAGSNLNVPVAGSCLLPRLLALLWIEMRVALMIIRSIKDI
jgi:hypothetical protein